MDPQAPADAVRRCTNCGALATSDAEWCGQCFASLVEPDPEPEPEPKPEPQPEPEPEPAPEPEPEPEAQSAPAGDLPPPTSDQTQLESQPGASVIRFPQAVRSVPWHQHFDPQPPAESPETPPAIVWPDESGEHPQG